MKGRPRLPPDAPIKAIMPTRVAMGSRKGRVPYIGFQVEEALLTQINASAKRNLHTTSAELRALVRKGLACRCEREGQ